MEHGRQLYRDLKDDVARQGRNPDHFFITPSAYVVCAETKAEAEDKMALIETLATDEDALSLLSEAMNFDFASKGLDEPFTDDELANVSGTQSMRDRVLRTSGITNPTPRDFVRYSHRARPNKPFVGGPKEVADGLEQWFTEPVADGFVLAATHVPGTYMDFVRHVVPELQRRGLYHKDYTGATLRENLGLPIPRASHPMENATMKLGLSIGYSRAQFEIPVKLVQRAEELGYDSVWTAEAYGTDAVTPLAFLAALTKRIKLGTGIMQLAARTPANAAMCAATVDAMAGGGRFIAGLGVSGPQIVEGWYGEPWGRPYYRYKDYVAIMRKIFRREAPVTHEGREISLPYTGEGAMGVGKPLKSILHMNPDIPIYLGTGNEATVKLTAEIADGWLPLGFVPGSLPEYLPWLEEGFRRAGNGKSLRDFAIQASVHVADRRRREGRIGEDEAGGRAVCRRHGPPRQELPQGHDDPARLQGCRRTHPGTVSRASQGRGDRRGARRMGGPEIARRATGANQAALPRVGGFRRHEPHGAFAPTGGDRGDGAGSAAQLREDQRCASRTRLR